MGQALVFGAVASASLIVGAAVGARWTLPDPLYERGGPYVAFTTVAGFFVAFILSEA